MSIAASVWDEERRARAALSALVDHVSPKLADLVTRLGAATVFDDLASTGVQAWVNRARQLDLEGLVQRSEALGVRYVVPGDPEWPEQLDVLGQVSEKGMGGSPLGLWLRGPGRLDQLAARAVAIVGSRACSPYGEQVATDLAIDLAAPTPEFGWTVVSGGAYGIDGWAHRGALAVGGATVAVLASGLDLPYPRGNSQLFDQLVAEHLLVSEYPVGAHPTRAGFLARNRVLAALASGTVVVEAAARSGANNTATWANAMSRVVMAVPGPVTSAQSVTPHRLIREQRATLVTGSTDVRALLDPLDRAPMLPLGGADTVLDALPAGLMAVREVLPGRGGLPLGEVSARSGLGVAQCLASLNELAGRGLARCDRQGEWHLALGRRSASGG